MEGLEAVHYEVQNVLHLPGGGAGFQFKCLWHWDGKDVPMLSHQKKPDDGLLQGSRVSQLRIATTERTCFCIG